MEPIKILNVGTLPFFKQKSTSEVKSNSESWLMPPLFLFII
jgi:hypothetical protein